MSSTQTIWQRFRRLPRAAQWALLAAVGLVLFLVYDDGVRPVTERWNERTDAMLADLEEAVRSDHRSRQVRAMKESVLALGAVGIPGAEAEAGRALNEAVNDVLKRHTVSSDSFTLRSPARLPRGTLSQLIDTDQRVQRITGDLRFNAAPDEATAIIALLEKRPEIEAISSVRITRQAGARKVTVDLTVDVWIVSVEPRSRGTGGV
ncbi:MAG: hypothetical protein ACYS0G_08650 [Planctomycetota bacterium]|jgi:hypothetical protein